MTIGDPTRAEHTDTPDTTVNHTTAPVAPPITAFDLRALAPVLTRLLGAGEGAEGRAATGPWEVQSKALDVLYEAVELLGRAQEHNATVMAAMLQQSHELRAEVAMLRRKREEAAMTAPTHPAGDRQVNGTKVSEKLPT